MPVFPANGSSCFSAEFQDMPFLEPILRIAVEENGCMLLKCFIL